MRRWGLLAALALAACGAPRDDRRPPPRGGRPCPGAVVAWAERCAAREGVAVPAVLCPDPGLALVDLGEGAPLRVELRRATARSFRRVGAWGLSPVGNFPDWSRVDAPTRDRFDRLAACVRADEGFARGLGEGAGAPRERAHGPAPDVAGVVPWLLLAALGCALLSLGGALRAAAWRRRAAWGAGMAAGAFALRSALLPGLFFHQNGQGALWVAAAVAPPEYHPYGPGYRSLFGWTRWLTDDPERGVFAAQGLLAALAVPAAAFVARRLGASRALAGAVALAVAVDPVLARLARSESYYGAGASLLLLAAALVAASASAPRPRGAGFALTAAGAGLVVAQHALVHPVGWLAAALLPALPLLGPGRLRRRVARSLAVAAVIAAAVAAFAGPSMLAVLRSPFGAQWAGGGARGAPGGAMLGRVAAVLPWGLVAAALVAAGARGWRRGAVHALALLGSLAALAAGDLVGFGATMPWVHQGYLRLYAPVAVALAAVAARRWDRDRARGRALAAAVAVAAVAVAAHRWGPWTRRPTDALEQDAVRRWRASLPAGAEVAWLERVGRRVLVLPVYRGAPRGGPAPVVLRPGGLGEDLARPGRRAFYVRGSLCATPEGRPLCEEVERRHRMTLLREVTLPAAPSMVGLGYDVPAVRVALYRVDGPARP